MQIRWTRDAVRDFTKMCDYIDERSSGSTARRVAIVIHTAIDLLEQFPEHGRTGRKPDTRELVITGLPYVVIYRLGRGQIEILRILHGAQIWP